MARMAFTMQLNAGAEAEYQKRHAEIWPELKSLLKGTGISAYSIFLDERTGMLFGVLNIDRPEDMKGLAEEPIMRKWWNYMADIMQTNPDQSPTSFPLREVFYLD